MLARLFKAWEYKLARRDTNRRTLPFEWGTEFVLSGAAPADPKEFLIEYAREVLANSDSYHCYSPVSDYRLSGNHLTFTTPLRTLYPKNNTVHARFFPVDSRGGVVLVLPQWNADAASHVNLCRMLNGFGLSALRLSLPYHDLRMPAELVRADYMLSPNLGRTLQALRQAVIDGRAALDWLQSRGYTKFAVLGTSIGSCVAHITMAHDPRLNLSVQNHVSPYFADVVWTGISTRHVRAGLGDNVALEELRQIWMPISPRAYMTKIAGTGKRSLLVHALYDHTFLPHLSDQVIEDYRKFHMPYRTFKLRCGHYTSGEFPFNIVLGFAMCNFLRRNL